RTPRREAEPPTEEELRRRQEIQEIKDLFARSFIALRKRRGFRSREALADNAGVNKESLGRLERGEGNSRLETLIRASLAMELSLAELFEAMGQRERQGRQLTVQERQEAVTGLLLALEAFTGRASGELTARGIERSTLQPPVSHMRYPKPRPTAKALEPSQSGRSTLSPPAPERGKFPKGAKPRKAEKSPEAAKSTKRATARKDAESRKGAKSPKSGKSREQRQGRRKP
ncbi:MAG: helix-turn-helix domain-containing protein, partial [Luteitalea sp.]|nr:helix-turn-helix domain-containing protein [Luteitalea sp.]